MIFDVDYTDGSITPIIETERNVDNSQLFTTFEEAKKALVEDAETDFKEAEERYKKAKALFDKVKVLTPPPKQLTTDQLMVHFNQLDSESQVPIMDGALDYMQQYNGRNKQDCIAMATADVMEVTAI